MDTSDIPGVDDDCQMCNADTEKFIPLYCRKDDCKVTKKIGDHLHVTCNCNWEFVATPAQEPEEGRVYKIVHNRQCVMCSSCTQIGLRFCIDDECKDWEKTPFAPHRHLHANCGRCGANFLFWTADVGRRELKKMKKKTSKDVLPEAKFSES